MKVVRRTMVLGALVLGTMSAGDAAPPPHGYIEGALAIPSVCGLREVAGGCGTPAPGLYVATGAPFLQPCALAADPGTGVAACSLTDGAEEPSTAAGMGSALVDDVAGCSSATITLASDAPSSIYIDLLGVDDVYPGRSRWKVTYLSITMREGAPDGLGYRWQIDSGSFFGTSVAGNDPIRVRFEGGEVFSAVACSSSAPVTGFTFKAFASYTCCVHADNYVIDDSGLGRLTSR
ncbi:MAG: hypothetical protein ABR548_06810 [Actinomycetota bacterium]|nr:hypothetical protein [Actinomycetota bacterium]